MASRLVRWLMTSRHVELKHGGKNRLSPNAILKNEIVQECLASGHWLSFNRKKAQSNVRAFFDLYFPTGGQEKCY